VGHLSAWHYVLRGAQRRRAVGGRVFQPPKSPHDEVCRRLLVGQHVQYLQHFLNCRHAGLARVADLAEPARRHGRDCGGVVAIPIAVPIAIPVPRAGRQPQTGRRAVQQQIDRSTIFVS
jgi:hypothetical protein